jgi:hypothetical protein
MRPGRNRAICGKRIRRNGIITLTMVQECLLVHPLDRKQASIHKVSKQARVKSVFNNDIRIFRSFR